MRVDGDGRLAEGDVEHHIRGLAADARKLLQFFTLLWNVTAELVEEQLCKAMPRAEWTRTSDTLILHGRRICKPRPLCEQCAVRHDCDYYRTTLGVTGKGRSSKISSRSASFSGKAPKPQSGRRARTKS
jgi:hypothetical protein